MTDLNNAKVHTVVDKVKCLITGHNSDSSSHEDIRVNLAGKANVADIPTKTSDLTNDSGFLTSHQDISGKANAVHTHSNSDLTDVSIVEVVIEYTDGTTETKRLLEDTSA